MLLLVTIGLVLVGAVSLVIGFVSNSLPPIYLSIACSVIAGIVLVVFSRMSKRQEAGGPSSSGFSPAPSGGAWTPPPPPSPSPAPSYRPPAAPVPTSEPAPAPARTAAVPSSAVAVEEFPIEDYETLRVSQILPALDDLDLDQLDVVREREEQGKNRTTVLRRIDVLMDELEGQDGAGAPAEPMMGADDGQDEIEGGLVPEEDDLDDDLLDDEELDTVGLSDEDEDDLDDGMASDEPDRTEVMVVRSADDSFPIPDYDRLPVAQILPLLDDLDDDELDMVAEREEQGKNRAAILDRIDDMFEPLETETAPSPPPPPPGPVKRAPAKKAVAKKAVAKKATPVKATSAKRAVKTPAVKKAGVKKAAPVKRPSPVTRTPAKKAAPAKRTPAKRTPAAVKKVAKKR